MKQPQKWRPLERHPLSAEYADLAGAEYDWLCADIRTNGFDKRHPIILYDGKIIDGWQRQRACIEMGIRPFYAPLPRGVEPEDFVTRENDQRRHEGEESRRRRVAARRERVAAAAAAGKSMRTIATEEGVSRTTVLNDLSEPELRSPSGVNGLTPETTDSQEKVDPDMQKAPEKPKTVTGRDGKNYPAEKPKIYCTRCTNLGPVHALKDCQACKDARAAARAGKPKPADNGAPRKNTMESVEVLDANRQPVPDHCKKMLNDEWVQKAVDLLVETEKTFREARLIEGMDKRRKTYPHFDAEDFTNGCGYVIHYLIQLRDHLKDNRPAFLCPDCKGDRCPKCLMSGMVSRKTHQEMTK